MVYLLTGLESPSTGWLAREETLLVLAGEEGELILKAGVGRVALTGREREATVALWVGREATGATWVGGYRCYMRRRGGYCCYMSRRLPLLHG